MDDKLIKALLHTDEIPLMKCGHAANSVGIQHSDPHAISKPACAICSCFEVMETNEQIDFAGRIARCSYYGKKTHKNECRICTRDGFCACERPSTERKFLAFFEYRPDEDCDSFYCGCQSWD